MNRKENCCHFCRTILSPQDPTVIRHNHKIAHEHCIIDHRSTLERVTNMMVAYVEQCGHPDAIQFWEECIKSGRVNSRNSLIRNIALCFSKMKNPKAVPPVSQIKIRQVKSIMGDRLMYTF